MLKRTLTRIDGYQRRRRWLAVPVGVFRKFGDDRAGSLAALIAYYGFFSLFPLLLALTTILGFALEGNPDLQDSVVDSVLAQFPLLGSDLEDDIGSVTGSGLALTIGLGGALWAGMGAVQAAQRGMDEVWDVPIVVRPTMVVARLKALAMLVVLGVGVLASTLGGGVVSGLAGVAVLARMGGLFGAYLLAVAVLLVSYRLLVTRRPGWREVLPGALVAGLGWVVLQSLGGIYIERVVTNASDTYGTFAVVIGMLTLLHLQAQLVLIGAEVNVVTAERLWPRSLTATGEDLTEADRRALRRYARAEQRIEGTGIAVDFSEVGEQSPGGPG